MTSLPDGLPRRDLLLIPAIAVLTVALLALAAENAARFWWPEIASEECVLSHPTLGFVMAPNCAVTWKAAGLGALAGKPVRFRFHLRNGRLYAFWVSPDASGASHGYVAAGGPGFAGPVDTVGQR